MAFLNLLWRETIWIVFFWTWIDFWVVMNRINWNGHRCSCLNDKFCVWNWIICTSYSLDVRRRWMLSQRFYKTENVKKWFWILKLYLLHIVRDNPSRLLNHNKDHFHSCEEQFQLICVICAVYLHLKQAHKHKKSVQLNLFHMLQQLKLSVTKWLNKVIITS